MNSFNIRSSSDCKRQVSANFFLLLQLKTDATHDTLCSFIINLYTTIRLSNTLVSVHHLASPHHHPSLQRPSLRKTVSVITSSSSDFTLPRQENDQIQRVTFKKVNIRLNARGSDATGCASKCNTESNIH